GATAVAHLQKGQLATGTFVGQPASQHDVLADEPWKLANGDDAHGARIVLSAVGIESRVLELLEGTSRSLLLCLLLATGLAPAPRLPRHPDFDEESTLVVRTGCAQDDVLGQFSAAGLCPFLQRRLGVASARATVCPAPPLLEAGLQDPAGLLEAGVDHQGTGQGLEGVGEDGGPSPAARPLLADAQAQSRSDAQMAAQCGQGRSTDEGGAAPRQFTLIGLRMALLEPECGRQADHCIPEELEALEVVGRAMVVGPGAMRQGAVQKIPVPETVPQPLLQAVYRPLARRFVS